MWLNFRASQSVFLITLLWPDWILALSLHIASCCRFSRCPTHIPWALTISVWPASLPTASPCVYLLGGFSLAPRVLFACTERKPELPADKQPPQDSSELMTDRSRLFLRQSNSVMHVYTTSTSPQHDLFYNMPLFWLFPLPYLILHSFLCNSCYHLQTNYFWGNPYLTVWFGDNLN